MWQRDALVEYFSYTADDGQTYYVALVLRPHYKYPQLVKISSEEVIKKQLKDGVNGDFTMLWFTLWQPIEQYLSGVQNVYVVPAGVLNVVPFRALHYGSDHIVDRYTLRNLLSSIDLPEQDSEASPFRNKTALLVGGADYDTALHMKGGVEQAVSNDNVYDGLRAQRGQGFGYLSGSLQEVNTIVRKLAGSWRVARLTDIKATENQLRHHISDYGSPEILHISTHGFYIPDRVVEGGASRGNLFSVSKEPLMRLGLLLAGANSIWNNEKEVPSVDDGILTASEIASINLSETVLAVLSACETGLGAIDGNEGVYGLQRSLRMAGVKSMLVSLWKIPDKETAQFMSLFYGLIAEGMPLYHAFRATQQEVRRRNPYQPNLWAGFVLIE